APPGAFPRPIADFLAAKWGRGSPGMPPPRLQTCREELYLRAEIEPNPARPSQSFQSVRLHRARPRTSSGNPQGKNVMTAAAATKQTQAPLSNKAREMMEAINADAA